MSIESDVKDVKDVKRGLILDSIPINRLSGPISFYYLHLWTFKTPIRALKK